MMTFLYSKRLLIITVSLFVHLFCMDYNLATVRLRSHFSPVSRFDVRHLLEEGASLRVTLILIQCLKRFETVWKGATLIKERCLFEVRPLFILDALNVNKQSSCQFSDRPDRVEIRVYYKNPHVSLKTYIWISVYKKSYQ